MRGGRRLRGTAAVAESGQAAVEFVALLPLLVLMALGLAQCAVAGYAAWSASGAARIGARAQALGEDPQAAVRRVLPRMLTAGARIGVDEDGESAGLVRVRLRLPSVVPGLHVGVVHGRAELPDQAGA